jgi:predicted DNA-binding protein YlxM (UPF0122 family)
VDKRYYRKLNRVKDQVITAYSEHNLSMQEIAVLFDSSPPTVYRLLKKYKVKRRRRGQRVHEVRVVAEKMIKDVSTAGK